MPLLRRQVLQKASPSERLKDSDEVLYCEATGEIFSNYEDYFHRVMLISSMVWSCAMTGRPNLTYAEAIESEKTARKVLRTFPSAVKGPFLLVASRTQRTAINEMHEDVYGFVKDHLFRNETVEALDVTRKQWRTAVVTNVTVDSTGGYLYHVTANDGLKPATWTTPPTGIKRDRSVLTRDKCKLFLKQHVEASGPGGQLRIKQSSLARYVTEAGLTDEKLFFGQPPTFGQSKRLKANADRGAGGDGAAASPGGTKAPKKKPAADKQPQKKQKQEGGSKKKQDKQQAGAKQQSKHPEKTGPETAPAAGGNAKAKKLAEEMAAAQQRKLEHAALVKKRLEEEKALLLQQTALALKRYNAVLDDQDLPDQRPMPAVQLVRPLVPTKYFGSFVFILEFLNSFADLLAVRSKFSGGLTMHLLERALILREVNGPLSDILQVLLSAIFTQQAEEESEVDVRYERVENLAQKRQTVPEQVRARDAALWCERHYCAKLNELPMDSMTVSELLRLHFLASGAVVEERVAKQRYYNRGGYGCADDPGLRLVQDYPHILRALRSYSVYQLPIGDIVQILSCLIHQLLTYGGVRELVEERVERARSARLSYQNNRYAQRRLTVKTGSQKNAAREDMKRELAAFAGGDGPAKEEQRQKLQERLEEQCARFDAEAARQMKVLHAESARLKEDFFDYQIYLGTDRCFRKYWLFESLPGLFVEHDRKFAGRCLDVATPNYPGLAQCAPEQRKKLITKAIMRCAGSNAVAALLDVQAIEQAGTGAAAGVGEVYEQLLALGCAELHRDAAQQPTANGAAVEAAAAAPATPAAAAAPTPSPTNRELLMCTTLANDCPVHTVDDGQTVGWGYYATAAELDALIHSLNGRGTREKALRETLECERDLIVKHIEMCPVEKLSVGESPLERNAALAEIVMRNQKRYDAPNFSHDPGTEPNEILESVFVEHLLELEAKITVGYLGVMRVHDRDRWREALEAGEYDPQTDKPLQWGPKRLAKQEQQVRPEQQEQGESPDAAPPQRWGETERAGSEHGSDASDHNPGAQLPDTTVSLMDVTVDDGANDVALEYPLHESDTLRTRVLELARALLQVAQCIDQKFLRHPFGPKKDHKDRAVMLQMQYQGQRNLVQWEESLMGATCYAQLFLHYNVLSDAIHWSRSAERISCMICRRKGDPGLTLLCDECNRAAHTYCLKPKLKVVPDGDWYCMRCRPENFQVKRAAPAKKKNLFKWKEEDGEEDEEDDEVDEGVEEMSEDEEDEEEEEEANVDEAGGASEQAEDEEPEQDEEQDGAEEEQEDEEDEEEDEQEEEESDGSAQDDGSDDDYRTTARRTTVARGAASRQRPAQKKKPPAIVVTSSGRTVRSAKLNNGGSLYRDDNDDDEDDEDDGDDGGGGGDEDEMEEQDDEQEGRSSRRRGFVLPTSKRATRDRKRTVTPAPATKRKRQEEVVESGATSSKRPRRVAAALTNGGGGGGAGEDEPTSTTRISARTTKGQRRSGLANGAGAADEDETAGGTPRRSRRTGDDLPLNSVALYTLIDDVLKHPSSWPFNRPVSAKEVPDYYAVIKCPMDFARVKSKLNMGDYTINEQMLSDMQLVFRNCDLYNTDETDVYRIGCELERYVVKRCKELGLPFQPSDMQKGAGAHQNGHGK
uniref:Bromodomain adjacent to zinc finger domain protein 1A n=1 Tax=Anopheles dirus TaxID=7168 RepID=A0A182N167_9DIPT